MSLRSRRNKQTKPFAIVFRKSLNSKETLFGSKKLYSEQLGVNLDLKKMIRNSTKKRSETRPNNFIPSQIMFVKTFFCSWIITVIDKVYF